MNKNNGTKLGMHLFKLAGFDVSLDWTWIFLAILVTWTLAAGYFPANFPGINTTTLWIMGIVGALGLFFSLILHEFCHSLVGRHFGIPISGITLFIFGGVAEMREIPPNPKAEFLMSIAGPLCSIGLGIIFYLFFQISIHSQWPVPITGVVRYLSIINFIIGIFNLLPGFPLDGGRIFRSLLWWWKGDVKWATDIACRGGVGLGFGMVIFGILLLIRGAIISGIWMFLLGFFLQHLSKMSYQDLLIRKIFSGEHIKKYTKTNPITVPPNITVQELIENYFYHYYHKLYPVVERDNLMGYISFNEIQQIDKSNWEKLYVNEVMHHCSPDIMIDAETDVTKVIQRMTAQKISRLIVTEHSKLYGVITLKDIMDVISIRMNLEGDNH